MTRQTPKTFLESHGVYSEKNLERFNEGWTLTELKNGFEFEIMKPEFYSDVNKYHSFMDNINKYQ